MSNLLKEKAYKLLAEHYRRIYVAIRTRAENALEYGQKDDHTKVLRTVVNEVSVDSLTGIISPMEREVIRVLEYLLDDTQVVK